MPEPESLTAPSPAELASRKTKLIAELDFQRTNIHIARHYPKLVSQVNDEMGRLEAELKTINARLSEAA